MKKMDELMRTVSKEHGINLNQDNDMNEDIPQEIKWVQIGVAGVDAGALMIGDPCYFIGTNSEVNRVCSGDWGKFIEAHLKKEGGFELNHQMNYHAGHAGLGVMASTAYGDGAFPVYALKGAGGDRAYAMLVVTGDEEDVPDYLRQIMKGEQPTNGAIAKQFGDPSDPVE